MCVCFLQCQFPVYNFIWHFLSLVLFLLPWKSVCLLCYIPIFPSCWLFSSFVIKCLLVCSAFHENSWRKMLDWPGKLFEKLCLWNAFSQMIFFPIFFLVKRLKRLLAHLNSCKNSHALLLNWHHIKYLFEAQVRTASFPKKGSGVLLLCHLFHIDENYR